MRAHEILQLLRQKHEKDVFVSECKDGATQSRIEHFKLDAWVMNKSWANPCVTGYEVKVSRSDFLRDEKWRAYLPLCNEFYFVCPHGLIGLQELPADVGLLYASKNGARLMAQRKAVYRDVVIPEDVFRYVLMCRSTIDGRGIAPMDLESWRRWFQEKAEMRRLGWKVAKGIRETTEAVQRENERLRAENETYAEIKAFLQTELGLPSRHHSTWNVRRKLSELRQAVPLELLDSLRAVARAAAQAETQLQKLNQSHG